MDDTRVERIIGTLLRFGVLLAAGVVMIGAIFYLARHGGETAHYGHFQGEPSDLRGFGGILAGAFEGRGRNIIQLGLLLLIATPVARVAFSVVAFTLERDRVYVVITLIVLAVLMWSLMGGH